MLQFNLYWLFILPTLLAVFLHLDLNGHFRKDLGLGYGNHETVKVWEIPSHLRASTADEIVGALQIILGLAAISGVAAFGWWLGAHRCPGFCFGCCMAGCMALMIGLLTEVQPLTETPISKIQSEQVFRSLCLWLGVVLPIGGAVGLGVSKATH